MQKILLLSSLLCTSHAQGVNCSKPVYSHSGRYYVEYCSDGEMHFYDVPSKKQIPIDIQTVFLIQKYEQEGKQELVTAQNHLLDSMTLYVLDDFKDIEMPEVLEVETKPSITTQLFTDGAEGDAPAEPEYQDPFWS